MSCRHPQARNTARRAAMASPVPMECAICGYQKHVDCCHIRPVASFPDGTAYTKINALSNLVWLCPTHHWEMDHNLMKFIPPSIAELEKVPPPAKVRTYRPKPKAKPGPLPFTQARRLPIFLKRLHLK